MARTIKTPGVTPTPEDQIKTEGSTLETGSDQQLVQESNQSTNETSQQVDDVQSPVENLILEQKLDEIAQTQKSIENKLDQLLAAGGIKPQAKKRWVQGKHSLEYKEV